MQANSSELLSKISDGFNTLDLASEYKKAAQDHLSTWLTDNAFQDYVPQIEYLVESGKWELLLDSFYQVIPFGTGGRRGPVGIGPNRINMWTIMSSAQGHAQFLLKRYGDDAKSRGVVLSFDVRCFQQKGIYNDAIPNPVMDLNCKDLALAAAQVYTANGIKVFLFDDVRSTPELSFAIRHLGAVSGDMFSASHNPPTDNGKKIYDEYGGQLVAPDDQALVDEVTTNVSEIRTIAIDEAKSNGLLVEIGEEVDKAYWDAVAEMSHSEERGIKVLYSPLHGTGLTSVYPILQRLGFDVKLNPSTSNMSGAFENVTFNNPNPEVRESFDSAIETADKENADIILSTDPDADRAGALVKHNGQWAFLNGNELGFLLTQYGISKHKAKGLFNENSIVVKTCVTTSLIEKIATQNGASCVSDLLVGFKYIGNEMNRLQAENRMNGFILGTEESHGFLVGNYARDKDAGCASVWLSELAAELKKENKTLVDYVNDIYSTYGYCHNYLTEIRLTGAKGQEQIAKIMEHFRSSDVGGFGEFQVAEKIDRWVTGVQPHLSATDTASRNVLIFHLAAADGLQSAKVIVRPSGTEPKVKIYFELFGEPVDSQNLDASQTKIVRRCDDLEKAFMTYCYQLLGVEFPERGFLLFWQLPLKDKLHYFEIEDQVAALRDAPQDEKEKRLAELFAFLGADPIEKVDRAFAAKYENSLKDYLRL